MSIHGILFRHIHVLICTCRIGREGILKKLADKTTSRLYFMALYGPFKALYIYILKTLKTLQILEQ